MLSVHVAHQARARVECWSSERAERGGKPVGERGGENRRALDLMADATQDWTLGAHAAPALDGPLESISIQQALDKERKRDVGPSGAWFRVADVGALSISEDRVHAAQFATAAGATLTVLTYGAAVVRLAASETAQSIVLGYDSLDEYEHGSHFLGAVVGRVCNRVYPLRFRVESDGPESFVVGNDGGCTVANHGGKLGFSNRVWRISKVGHEPACEGGVRLVLEREALHGEQGFAGSLRCEAHFSLRDLSRAGCGLELCVDLISTALPGCATVANLTLHPYFNLNPDVTSSVMHSHTLKSRADRAQELAPNCAATSELTRIDEDDCLNFRERRLLASKAPTGGYDRFLLMPADELCRNDGSSTSLREVAELACGTSTLHILSDQPGFQLYTGNFLDAGSAGFLKHQGVCVEPSLYLNAVNFPELPSITLQVGESRSQCTTYRVHLAQ